MTCTVQFLCALRSEQWGEENADPSGNKEKFTKQSGSQVTWHELWTVHPDIPNLLLEGTTWLLKPSSLESQMKNISGHEKTEQMCWHMSRIPSCYCTALLQSQQDWDWVLTVSWICLFWSTDWKQQPEFLRVCFVLFFLLYEFFNYSPKFCISHLAFCSSSRALYKIVMLGDTSP